MAFYINLISVEFYLCLTCKKLRASRWRHSRKWACLCSNIKWEMLPGIRTSRPSRTVRTSSGLHDVHKYKYAITSSGSPLIFKSAKQNKNLNAIRICTWITCHMLQHDAHSQAIWREQRFCPCLLWGVKVHATGSSPCAHTGTPPGTKYRIKLLWTFVDFIQPDVLEVWDLWKVIWTHPPGWCSHAGERASAEGSLLLTRCPDWPNVGPSLESPALQNLSARQLTER